VKKEFAFQYGIELWRGLLPIRKALVPVSLGRSSRQTICSASISQLRFLVEVSTAAMRPRHLFPILSSDQQGTEFLFSLWG